MEVGAGSLLIRWLSVLAGVGLAFVVYDLRAYKGFASPEAMDAAQLAKNIEEGRGFSTYYIRPFSIYLVKAHNQAENSPGADPSGEPDFARVNEPHPDLANPPVYPLALAGLMKTMKPAWKMDLTKPFWSQAGMYMRYKPEFRIAVFNQVLFLIVMALTFLITRKLCDAQAAWLAAVLTLGSELLWKFSVSGLSTMLVLVIFMGLAWCLMTVAELSTAEEPKTGKLYLSALAIGLLMGVGMLTRYSFGWLIFPVAGFLIWAGGGRRIGPAAAAVVVFGLVVTPWLMRNYSTAGTFFGTAGYALIEGTSKFPGNSLMQSLNPNSEGTRWLVPCLKKILGNGHQIVQGELLPVLGWGGALFFSGLVLPWRNQVAQRLRYFVVASLIVFILVEAGGRTNLSNLTPDINSENLLVLLAPLANIFGAAFFLTLLARLPRKVFRYVATGSLILIACGPLVWTAFSKASPRVYPPYYPPEIQQVAGWMQPDELMMSDVPWAVAWYGQKPCVWLTLNTRYTFSELNDNVKAVRGLYLTSDTLDAKLLNESARGEVDSWARFALDLVRPPANTAALYHTSNEGAEVFPLTVRPTTDSGFYGAGVFVTDRPRWH